MYHATAGSPLILYVAFRSSSLMWSAIMTTVPGDVDDFSTTLARVVQWQTKDAERLVHTTLVTHATPANGVVEDRLVGRIVPVPHQHLRAVVEQPTNVAIVCACDFPRLLRTSFAFASPDNLFECHNCLDTSRFPFVVVCRRVVRRFQRLTTDTSRFPHGGYCKLLLALCLEQLSLQLEQALLLRLDTITQLLDVLGRLLTRKPKGHTCITKQPVVLVLMILDERLGSDATCRDSQSLLSLGVTLLCTVAVLSHVNHLPFFRRFVADQGVQVSAAVPTHYLSARASHEMVCSRANETDLLAHLGG